MKNMKPYDELKEIAKQIKNIIDIIWKETALVHGQDERNKFKIVKENVGYSIKYIDRGWDSDEPYYFISTVIYFEIGQFVLHYEGSTHAFRSVVGDKFFLDLFNRILKFYEETATVCGKLEWGAIDFKYLYPKEKLTLKNYNRLKATQQFDL